MAASFAELKQEKIVSPNDIKATLKDCAESGTAILGQVVIKLIDRVPMTRDDLSECLQSAEIGVVAQQKVCSSEEDEIKESGEYSQVADHVRSKIAGLKV